MKRTLWACLILLGLTGCGQWNTLLYQPRQTPESWLTFQPYTEFHLAGQTILIVQPTTSALVYLLGITTLGVGVYFWRIRHSQRARKWWGVALGLWGIGALLAGTSYEAFSYAIKCAGREACVWTSEWELAYLLVSVASIDAMFIAQAYACATGRWRQGWIGYALTHFMGYLIALGLGIVGPIQFLISFEFLLMVTAPNLLIFIFQNSWRYARARRPMDLALLGTWGGLMLTLVAYFVYGISGLPQQLWAHGIWFSDNDVLHIGLILWMIYLAVIVAPRIQDKTLTIRPA